MKVKSLLSSILFFYFIHVHAQSSITWQLDIGGSGIEYSSIILPTDDGGFIVGGSTESGQTGIFSDPQLTSSIFSIFLFKYDVNHVLEWQKSFGGDAFSELGNIIRTQDNGWLITGWSAASSGSGNKTSPLYGSSDFWVIKLNSQFQLKWQNSYGGSGGDELKDAIELWDGSILLGGRSESPISGTKTDTCRGFYDYWLVKIDSLGNQLWDKTLGSIGYENLSSLSVSSNGNITLSGTTEEDTLGTGEKTEPMYGHLDFWVISLDSMGNILWDKTLGGPQDEYLGTIYTDGINYYVGGNSDSTSLIAPTMRTAPSKGGTYDCWLIKLDNNGNVLWNKCYGGNRGETIEQIIQFNSNELILASISNSDISGDKTESIRGFNSDFWLVKIDTAGNVIWDKTIGGSQEEYYEKITIIDANTIYLTGMTESGYSGDKTCNNNGSSDVWILEFKPNTLGIAENVSEQFSIYPNPVQNQFTVQSENASQIKQIDITNLSGQVMGHYYPETKNKTTISMDKFPSGIYWVNIIGDDFVSKQKIVKM